MCSSELTVLAPQEMQNSKYDPERKILSSSSYIAPVARAGRDPEQDPNPKYLLMRHPSTQQQLKKMR